LAAAQEPLWKTMEYFRSWWRGRGEELKDSPSGAENIQLERALRLALAQADGWVLGEAGLNRLRGLSSSDWCGTEAGGWAQAAKPPIRLDVYPGSAGFEAHFAQYDARSAEEFRRRLSQYPEACKLSAGRVSSSCREFRPDRSLTLAVRCG
jgi:hypothetical protein